MTPLPSPMTMLPTPYLLKIEHTYRGTHELKSHGPPSVHVFNKDAVEPIGNLSGMRGGGMICGAFL